MRKSNIARLILALSFLSGCINAPRNNKYDPKNPDKAEIRGCAIEPDGLAISNAVINLIDYENNIIQCDTSDVQGCFSFNKIDPGIYKITAKTRYFTDVLIENASLWAGTELYQYPIFFTTFHFEVDEINSIPYGFTRINGEWKVISDTNGNHIYNGLDTDDNTPTITLLRNRTHNLKFNMKLKVSGTSGEEWRAGIFLWYQDELNHYKIIITNSIIRYLLIKNGAEAEIYRKNITFANDVWHTITTVHYADVLVLYLDGVYQFPISLVAPVFSNGYWGLYIQNLKAGGIAAMDVDEIYLKIVNWGG